MSPRRSSRPLWLLLAVSVAALFGAAALTLGGPGNESPTETPATPSAPSPTDAAVGSGPPATLHPGTTAEPSAPASSNGPSGGPTPLPTIKQYASRSVEPEELTGYVWPLRNARITSRFAPRDLGAFVVIDGKGIHDGLDLATHCGDEVRAAHDGTVLYAGRNFDVFLGYRGKPEQIYARLEQQGRVNTLPIVIVIDDGNGYRSLYVHLSEANVEAGDVVRAGDVIGVEGATGLATGCHLHYGLIRMDAGWQEVVPRLARYGYPALVRERIDPLRVLPWDDQYAPERLRNRVNESQDPGQSPSPETASPAA